MVSPLLLLLWTFMLLFIFFSYVQNSFSSVGNKQEACVSLCLSSMAMKDDSLDKEGTSHQSGHCCPSLEQLSSKIGSILQFFCHANRYKRLDAKLEKKMIEVKRSCSSAAAADAASSSSSGSRKSFKSINTIIMRFPQFKQQLKAIRGVFQQFDEDGNGYIDREELKKCLEKLQLLNLKDSEVDDLFHSCDFDGSGGIQFNEFIVLLCLVYLLAQPPSSSSSTPNNNSNLQISKMGSPELEATFDTIVEAFLFLDKNGDGKLNRKDLVNALNDASPWEKSPLRITKSRFKEMDRDRNGKVSFREFLFALIQWVGMDDADEDEQSDGKLIERETR